jgi:hypothetical protein
VLSVVPGGQNVAEHPVPRGYAQAPDTLQSVAPQEPPVQTVAGLQQWVPAPFVPHRLLEHWLLPEQVAPAPPLATQEPLEQ